ncbi:uncharacterized protein L969DRAFT_50787 [Mixia osmundae IAM 14324]|uniref:acylphosphatase n=1 Tax=Mixia osmundae (strain CBS 9802 / IAM 14324 / JCM 22182 / KY 12970) TaxID=764103 RepID=G7DZ38_MIXOS|nr:uncharacterized protein L969DRAFT_50787 [Mixia osmundae IAM 14324]KEI38249.1 hypothetical protein L969DRAFT_50787 [Mixia osmundae IAM 14324]GAA95848.1 hypothetical protein E5Q_02505 [Mixia osmundae IAM 14324]
MRRRTGVGYRHFARGEARGLAGWIRNTPDGAVEAVVSGDDAQLDKFNEALKRGPSHAHVERVERSDVNEDSLKGYTHSFSVIE